MHRKFEINQTNIKGGCHSGIKATTHDSKSDLPLQKTTHKKFLSFQSQKAVTFSEEYYDFSEKLVSFEFAPRSHSPPAIFFSRFLINSGFPNDLYRIVHDFSAEVQYTLNER